MLRKGLSASLSPNPTLLCGSVRSSTPSFHQVLAKEDVLDQQVVHFMGLYPQLRQNHNIARRVDGSYELDGRQVLLEWQPQQDNGTQGCLVVVDGPLRQPFLDYISKTEANAEYEAIFADSNRNPLQAIPKERMISFNDQHQAYSRLDAMKVAKEQALVREKAVGYLQAGRALPDDMLDNYQKNLQKKLAPVSINSIRARGARLS